MVFNKFVEVGRVVMVTYGPDYGKFAVIVDIIDQSRALVDGPGIKRQQLAYRRMQLTEHVVKIPRTIGTTALLKALEKQSFEKLIKSTGLYKREHVKAIRANLTDFDRFKVMVAKRQRRLIVDRELHKLKQSK